MVQDRPDRDAERTAAPLSAVVEGVGRREALPWTGYRWRWRAFVIAMLILPTWPITGSLISAAFARLGLADRWAAFAASPAAALGPVIVAHLVRISWRCPRCRRPFHVSRWRGDPFGRRCIHCGLPVGADPAQASG